MSLPSGAWGKSIAISLHDCEHDRLTNPELLKQFVGEAIEILKMQAHGPCCIDRFGEGDIEGWSAMQFIKTSTITVHLDEIRNRAFIDLFSCQEFDADKAQQFSQEFFGAKTVTATVLER